MSNTETKQPEKGRKKLSLMTKIVIGLVAGILIGIVFGEKACILSPIGDLFLKMLKMLVLPLVFSAIVSGIAGLTNMKQMARMSVKALIIFVVMTALAIGTGLIFGDIFQPGTGAGLSIPNAEVTQTEAVTFTDTILNMIPDNIFSALSENSMLQVIVFAFFFGICTVLAGEKASMVGEFFIHVANVMYKMTDIIISFAPFGVCAMIANIIGQYGISALLPLGKFLIIFHLAILFFFLVVQGGLVLLVGHMNPLKFYKAILKSITMAYVTDSSAATLPIAIQELENNLNVDKATASFIMGVGTNISKSGSALYQGIVAVFIAQIMGLNLSFAQQFTVLMTALLASLGTAGIPSASLVMLSMTLNCVGLPLEGIALMAGIDRILGGARTFPNVVTNAAAAVILDRQEKKA